MSAGGARRFDSCLKKELGNCWLRFDKVTDKISDGKLLTCVNTSVFSTVNVKRAFNIEQITTTNAVAGKLGNHFSRVLQHLDEIIGVKRFELLVNELTKVNITNLALFGSDIKIVIVKKKTDGDMATHLMVKVQINCGFIFSGLECDLVG